MKNELKDILKTITSAVKEMVNDALISSQNLNEDRLKEMVQLIKNAKNIFILGVGHSGLVGRAFAMRLMHLGFRSYVVGETTTPGLLPGDLLISISQSGETTTVVTLTKKAKELGAKIVGITSKENSTLANLADCLVQIKISPEKCPILSKIGDEEHKNLSGTLFGVNTFLFFHGLISYLIIHSKQNPTEIDKRHANLQ